MRLKPVKEQVIREERDMQRDRQIGTDSGPHLGKDMLDDQGKSLQAPVAGQQELAELLDALALPLTLLPVVGDAQRLLHWHRMPWLSAGRGPRCPGGGCWSRGRRWGGRGHRGWSWGGRLGLVLVHCKRATSSVQSGQDVQHSVLLSLF